MGTLIYASNMSLDGFTEDAQGALDWAPPNEDVFAFTTGLMRLAGTYLYGRRMYESMAVWETDPSLGQQTELTRTFAEILNDPATRKRLINEAAEPRLMEPEAIRSLIASEVKKWTEVAASAGIRVK